MLLMVNVKGLYISGYGSLKKGQIIETDNLVENIKAKIVAMVNSDTKMIDREDGVLKPVFVRAKKAEDIKREIIEEIKKKNISTEKEAENVIDEVVKSAVMTNKKGRPKKILEEDDDDI